MRRHWSQRVCATLFAIWFAVVGLEPGALGACAMHQTAAGMLAGMHTAGDHASHVANAGNAANGEHAAHGEHGEHQPGPEPQHTHHCTCPGSCCATALAVPPAPATGPHVVAYTATYVAPALGLRAAWTDFVLPFGTAPPARALA